MMHGACRAWAVNDDLLAFGPVLGVPICAEIILSYVESANRGCLAVVSACSAGWRWIAPGTVGSRDFHGVARISLTLSTDHFMGAGT